MLLTQTDLLGDHAKVVVVTRGSREERARARMVGQVGGRDGGRWELVVSGRFAERHSQQASHAEGVVQGVVRVYQGRSRRQTQPRQGQRRGGRPAVPVSRTARAGRGCGRAVLGTWRGARGAGLQVETDAVARLDVLDQAPRRVQSLFARRAHVVTRF